MRKAWRSFCLALAALLFCAVSAHGQSVPQKFDSAANTNSTLIKAGNGQLKWIAFVNQTATVNYLKMYDKATAPTCGTDTVVFKLPLPASATVPQPIVLAIPDGVQFFLGVGFCLTGANADSDTSNAVTGIVLNFGVKQ